MRTSFGLALILALSSLASACLASENVPKDHQKLLPKTTRAIQEGTNTGIADGCTCCLSPYILAGEKLSPRTQKHSPTVDEHPIAESR